MNKKRDKRDSRNLFASSVPSGSVTTALLGLEGLGSLPNAISERQLTESEVNDDTLRRRIRKYLQKQRWM